MAIPVVPYQDDGQGPIFELLKTTPYSPGWWTAQAISNIPSDSVGWLVSQGWQITGITYDSTVVPPEPYYAMTRQSLQNWMILQGLLEEWTLSYNTALGRNAARYNDVVWAWEQMMLSTQVHFDNQITEQNAHVLLYLGNLDTYMNEIDTLIDDNQTQIVADAALANTALTAAEARLSDLESNVSVAVAEIRSLLTDQDGNLATFLADFSTKLGELDTNYTAHLAIVNPLIASLEATLATFIADANTLLTTILADYTTLETEIDVLLANDASTLTTHAGDYNAVLALLEADYAVHANTSRQFLIDLGRTETARIAEKFTASLSTQVQQLVDRGLYSAALMTDITARNTRDHNEEIVALNDRLMREKLVNQHQLYGQQVTMRNSTMAGKDRIYGLRRELSQYHAAQITGVYGLLQDVRNRTLAAKQTILNVQQAVTQFTINVRDGLLAVLNGIVEREAAGIDREYTAKQDVSRVAMTEEERILAMVQDALKGLIAGKDRYAAALMQLSSTLAEHKHRAIVEKMNEFNARLAGQTAKHSENMALMAYQLDERNKLLIGIYSFVERREDVFPSFENLATICTSLGDAGGGWITP